MNDEKENLREYVKRWKETGKVLERLKLKEYKESNLSETLLSLTDASEVAIIQYPPRPTSGLIEMQKILKRIKKK